MKMKLLTVFTLSIFSFSSKAIVLDSMPINPEFEAKCASLPKTALPEEITECKNYHNRQITTANNRLRQCGTTPEGQSCRDSENLNINNVQQAADRMNANFDAQATSSALAAAGSKAACEKVKAEKKAAASNIFTPRQNEDKDGDTGTAEMKKCVQLSQGAMRYLHGKKRQQIDWKAIVDAKDECISECYTGPEAAAKQKACSEIKAQAVRCDAAAFLIAAFDRDWENTEHVVTKEVKGGTPPISCVGRGVATVDYEACVKFVQNGDIMDAAQGAVYKGQEIYYKDKAMTAQMEVSAQDNTGTGALTAMKEGVKGQEDMMTQRAALNTGKFAALVSYYSDIPDPGDLKAKCGSYSGEAINSLIPNTNPRTACESVAARQHEFGFLMNQQSKDKMKARLAKVGIDVASDAMMAALLAKRAKQLDSAIASVDAFKPIDPLAPPTTDLQTTFCQQNPGDPKCLTGGLERTYDAMGDNVISFGEGGTGVSYANNTPYVDPTAGTIDTTTPGGKKPVGSVGNVIASAQQNGGLINKAAAATVTKGSAPAGGGGGGGGSGGGLGGGGGAPAAGAPPGPSGGIVSKAPRYDGGTGFSVLGGGFGINKNKNLAKDDSNPFGKLFGNKNNNGSVDFKRGPASVGNKGDNIFEMISKRYTVVNTDKRLLEYELTK
ncbi:MAG: hypothetical protein WC635_00090 [Bacteriovorax sp.]|jgi:hypothetical protein